MKIKKGDKVIRIEPCRIATLDMDTVYVVSKASLDNWVCLEGFNDLQFDSAAFKIHMPAIVTNWREVLK